MSNAQKLAGLLLSRTDNEATAYPFWFIAIRGGVAQQGRMVMLRGIWFSREAAETHLKNKAHRYPKSAFVYCDSGHDSFDLKEVYELAKAIQEDAV